VLLFDAAAVMLQPKVQICSAKIYFA